MYPKLYQPGVGLQDATVDAATFDHREDLQNAADMARVIDAVTGMMAGLGYPHEDCFALRLALEEAVVNGFKHGNGGDPAKRVRVEYCVGRDEVLVQVEDEGPGFDPGRVADPCRPENLGREGGRGVLLIRAFMTWARYSARGNSVTFCKRRSA